MNMEECVHISVGPLRSQKKVLDPLELDFQLVVSCQVCMLGTKLQFSAGAGAGAGAGS